LNRVKKKHEFAKIDYLNGMTYREIAIKYGVALNTVKSWKLRHNWSKESATEDGAAHQIEDEQSRYQENREIILNSLVEQLIANDTNQPHYRDLVEDYMALWDIKNKLIADITERGVAVTWENGSQSGKKKNDSVNELNKTNKQMLTLLAALGLQATDLERDDSDADV